MSGENGQWYTEYELNTDIYPRRGRVSELVGRYPLSVRGEALAAFPDSISFGHVFETRSVSLSCPNRPLMRREVESLRPPYF